MKQNKNYSIFEYNPWGERLILTTNEKLQYDFKKQEYCINQNPFGEEKLVGIYDINITNNFDSITFNTIYRKKEKIINLTVNNNIDKALYKFIYDTLNKEINVDENELDSIEIVIINNKLDNIYIYKKNKEYELINSLGIVTRNGVLYYEEVEPEYKLYEFSGIEIENKKITIFTKEKNIEYPLDIQDAICNIFREIIKNIK